MSPAERETEAYSFIHSFAAPRYVQLARRGFFFCFCFFCFGATNLYTHSLAHSHSHSRSIGVSAPRRGREKCILTAARNEVVDMETVIIMGEGV